jgi:predicted enzyme related to lactoylglutathione lyase
MSGPVRFAHVNLVAEDWERLAAFYERVFGCVRIPPQRSLRGRWLQEGTGVTGAQVRGVHLRLPGHGEEGPTLEIFQYHPQLKRAAAAPNRPGLAHLAFAVEDVESAHRAVLAAGGGTVGRIVTAEIAGAGTITFAYVTDPEGNIIELQRWER